MKRLLVVFLCVILEIQCAYVTEYVSKRVSSNNSSTLDSSPTASSIYGKFQGTYNVTRLGRKFESYRGIRYVEPPVGPLRFEPPKLIQRYRDVVNATKDGPICPQLATENGTFSYEDMDEDCLVVNVYTPLKRDRRRLLPVIVYIHQGAFYQKNSRSDEYGPNYLLDRDIVLVTFNYRLASLGYLSTGDKLAPGNNGMKDQVALLKWVRRYIVAFGGNPGRVTIAGYSSGSISVITHLVSPMSRGLFDRAIAMSGSPTRNNETKTDLYELAVKQAELVNCSTENSTVILECLRTKPWIDFAKSIPYFQPFAHNPIRLWEPIVEKDFGQERFLTMNVIDAIRQGKINNVPTIISQNTAEDYLFAYLILDNDTLLKMANEQWDEFASIALFLPEQNKTTALEVLRSVYIKNETLLNDRDSADRLGTLYGDGVVAFLVERLSKLLAIHARRPVWYFEFTYVGNHSYIEQFTNNKTNEAVHQDETIYLFSQPTLFPDIGTEGEDAEIVNRMITIFTNFARYGNPIQRSSPELKGVTWPPLRANNRTYLVIDKQFSLSTNLKEERLQTWEDLYPINYN